jgi:hypothetical protein
VHGPRTTAPTQEEELDCTEVSVMPKLDMAGAITGAVIGTFGAFRLHGGNPDGLFLTPLLLVGALDLASGYYGYQDLRRCKEAKFYQDDMRRRGLDDLTHQKRLEIQQQAHDLTEEAAAASRAEDCGAVWQIERQVEKLDEEFYRTVFRANIAIHRCLMPGPDTYNYRVTGKPEI